MQCEVQVYARALMGRPNADSPFPPTCLATPDEAKRFEQAGDGAHCCDLATFRININTGAHNRWNRSAARVFVRGFLQTGEFECEDDKKIYEAFMTHVRTLRKKYREIGMSKTTAKSKKKDANRYQRKVTVRLTVRYDLEARTSQTPSSYAREPRDRWDEL